MTATTTKKKKPATPKKEIELIELPRAKAKHVDRRRRRVEWSLDIPTDGKGNTTIENVMRAQAHQDYIVNRVSEWAKMDQSPGPVEHGSRRERGKKPCLTLTFTLNQTLAAKLCRMNPSFRLL